MSKRIFICTYQNESAFETSKVHGLLGFSTNNTGAKGSIARLKKNDLVFVRDNTQKDSLTCFGVFEVTGSPFEVNGDAPLIWQEESAQNKALFSLRVPAKFIDIILPKISKEIILAFGWKKREKPYNQYKWQGLSRLFAVNFLEVGQAQQLAKLWNVDFEKLSSDPLPWQAPDEINNPSMLIEGAKKRIVVNAYERNLQARLDCIKHYGHDCIVCGFSFGSNYGEIGEGFIHVHHVKPLAYLGEAYEVNPVEDLRPVCPNCHAMLHKKEPPFTISELQLVVGLNKKI